MRLQTTKVSEASHAHGQRIASRSQKPLALAAYARKAFLAHVASAHRQHGGDDSWHRRSDEQLLRDASVACTTVRDRDRLLDRPLCDSAVCIEPADERLAELGLVEIRHDGQPPAAGLNPVLLALNQRLKAAKSLGVKIDAQFRRSTLAEIQAEYGTPAGKDKLMAEY